MPPKIKFCACGCGQSFESKNPRKRFATDVCRTRASKQKARVIKAEEGKHSTLTPAMQKFRELRQADDDFVREVLHEVVRAEVTEYTQDAIRGAAEILTGMLPLALASLYDDMEHGDEYIRGKARDAILKYGFMFKDTDGKRADDMKHINIITGVTLPDTPLGEAFVEGLDKLETIDVEYELEAFESDWPQCENCKERKHPDAMTSRDPKRDRWICLACEVARNAGRAHLRKPALIESGGDES